MFRWCSKSNTSHKTLESIFNIIYFLSEHFFIFWDINHIKVEQSKMMPCLIVVWLEFFRFHIEFFNFFHIIFIEFLCLQVISNLIIGFMDTDKLLLCLWSSCPFLGTFSQWVYHLVCYHSRGQPPFFHKSPFLLRYSSDNYIRDLQVATQQAVHSHSCTPVSALIKSSDISALNCSSMPICRTSAIWVNSQLKHMKIY